MSKKTQFSYNSKKKELENIIDNIDSSQSFEEKEELYIKGIEIINELEKSLIKQQDVISTIIKEK
ncbi:MAG: hypothetical protein KFW21_06200 [Spirochaetota bacterium]|nr:hypothetical protein [Spirochaetota bacterium]